MLWLPCPYLRAEVELTEEREHHIAERHPDLLPEHRERVAEVLAEPDETAGAFGSEGPDCSRDGTLICKEEGTWWLSLANPRRGNDTGSSRPTLR